jgi:hypothetical protein
MGATAYYREATLFEGLKEASGRRIRRKGPISVSNLGDPGRSLAGIPFEISQIHEAAERSD